MDDVKKRPSHITSLLAARPSALRRPPLMSEATEHPPQLRLVRNDHDESSTRPQSQPANSVSPQHTIESSDPIDAIRTASTAVAGIYALLTELIDRMMTPGRTHRRSPREIAELQARTDGALRDIDRIAERATVGSVQLLTGYWSATIPGPEATSSRRIPIHSMQTSHLGPDAINCMASLRTGGANSLMVTSVEDALIILRHASAQVAQCRRQLAGLVSRAAPDDSESSDIARENAAASQAACGELDFVEMTARLSPGSCLASSHHASRGRAGNHRRTRPLRDTDSIE